MGLINHNQVVVAPVEGLQIHSIHLASLAREVGVGEYGIGKTVFQKWIEFTVVLRQIDGPVIPQLLGAEYQHPMVAQFVVFDHRKG